MRANPIVTTAFLNGSSKKLGNLQTDGKILLLFGNRIAEHREDGIYISNCGYFTNTTKKHLNNISNVNIYQKNFKWFLNGIEWDGEWIKISNEIVVQKKSNIKGIFDTSLRYIKTDGWRGFEEPIYAIAGANDTGTWEDSPCNSNVCNNELQLAKKALGNIPTKIINCQSSNVFCIHRYLIVPIEFIDQARQIISEFLETEDGQNTSLLYKVS